MKPIFFTTLHAVFALLVALSMGTAYGQQYGSGQGYIFDQKYVQRIDLVQGEKLIGEVGGIEKFRKAYDWIKYGDELIPPDVSREGDRLVFKFKSRPELSLRDWEYNGESTGTESDYTHFSYLHTFANYHFVGVDLDHDEPGFLLIEKSGKKIYWVDHP